MTDNDGLNATGREAALGAWDAAMDDLADALEQLWWLCDEGSLGNLPEALSYGLALVARRIAASLPDPSWVLDTEDAGKLLVRHRPGCWEADHVRALVFPLELLPHEDVAW